MRNINVLPSVMPRRPKKPEPVTEEEVKRAVLETLVRKFEGRQLDRSWPYIDELRRHK